MSLRQLQLSSLSFVTLLASASALATDFAGAGVGAIPDNTPSGLNVTFNTTSFNQPVGDVKLSLNIVHTWSSDLKMTLTSPGGIARLAILSRVGRRLTGAWGSQDFSGQYSFTDFGADIWQTPSSTVIPPGQYRTSTVGSELVGLAPNDGGGCSTSLARAFGGLSAINSSGVWTLNIADVVGTDSGTVNSAILSLQPKADGMFRNGFEIASRGNCKLARTDFTGRGRSSFVILRNTGGGPTGAVTWYVKDNDSVTGGTETSFIHGAATDVFLQGDWDGDGLADAAVWRPGVPGQFIIRPSSHPTLLRTQAFGQTGDNPSIGDDFDGDGLTDFVLHRAGASAGLPSRTLIKLNATGVERDFITGVNGNFLASGDYNGDGAADIAVQEPIGGVGNFRLFSGLNGVQYDTFTQGLSSDFIQDGNFYGNYIDDITTIRTISGMRTWTTRDGQTGVVQPPVTFGITGDYVLNGDYDGDGLDDVSIWRPSITVGASKFSIRPSAAPATTVDVPMGANDDYPIGNARTH